MHVRRARSGALALAALVPSCASTDLDGSDREAFDFTSVEAVELDVSGLVLGIELAF